MLAASPPSSVVSIPSDGFSQTTPRLPGTCSPASTPPTKPFDTQIALAARNALAQPPGAPLAICADWSALTSAKFDPVALISASVASNHCPLALLTQTSP
ncbi:MAG TPA: hypothetical protein VII91_07450 [Bauldia sp.]